MIGAARLVATGVTLPGAARDDLEDLFGRRWNRRRPVVDEARPLLDAVVRAVGAAGWWEAGQDEPLAGGLVVGVDLHASGPVTRFGRALADPATVTRPSDFLFALPSSAAAVCGVALGLSRYQATIDRRGLSGFAAVGHAVDLIRLGRLSRAVAAALTFVGEEALEGLRRAGLAGEDARPFAMGVAWCLQAEEARRALARVAGAAIAEDEEGEGPTGRDTTEALDEVPAAYRHLAAPSLLAAERLLDPGGAPIRHRDPVLGACGVLHAAAETPRGS